MAQRERALEDEERRQEEAAAAAREAAQAEARAALATAEAADDAYADGGVELPGEEEAAGARPKRRRTSVDYVALNKQLEEAAGEGAGAAAAEGAE